MPMMAAYEFNDARDSARLLASRTLDGLRDRELAPAFENAINNMYRLLQGFRSHRFYGFSERVPLENDGPHSASVRPSDHNVGDLKHALEEAFHTAFGDEDRRSALDEIKVVLRMVAYPQAGAEPDQAELAKTERFFEVLLDNLDA